MWTNLGSKNYYEGDYNGAIECYTRALSMNPELYQAYYGRAAAKLKLDDPSAMNDLSKALSINPSFVPALEVKAGLLHSSGDYIESYLIETQIILLAPEDPVVYAAAARTLSEFGDLNEALELVEKGLSIKSDCGYCCEVKALILARLKFYPEALQEINRAIQIEGESGTNLVMRGLIYVKLKQYEAALPDILGGIDKGEKSDLGYNVMGEYYYGIGDYETALTYHIKAIELRPKNHYSYYFAGLSVYDMGKYYATVQYMTKAIELKADYIEAYYYRSLAERKLGMDTETKLDLEHVNELDPSFLEKQEIIEEAQ